jgi:hypothetical protein
MLPSQIAADPTAAARAQRCAALAVFRTRHPALSDFAPVAVFIGTTVRPK